MSLKRRIMDGAPPRLARNLRYSKRLIMTTVPIPFAEGHRGGVVSLHIGRSGSTVLGNMLKSHPAVFWDDELYHKANDLKLDFGKIDYRSWTHRQFKQAHGQFYGFECKVHPDQHLAWLRTDIAEFVSSMKAMGVTHFIIQRRRNVLRRMVSQYAGTKTQKRFYGLNEKPKLTTLHIDVEKAPGFGPGMTGPLLEHLRGAEQALEDATRAIGMENLLDLVFEEDIDGDAGPHRAYEKVCDFLNIDAVPVEVNLHKTNPYPLRDMIENYDEVRACLQGSRFEWMAD